MDRIYTFHVHFLQSTHKLQSNQGPLVLNLQQTPKLLQPLVKEWSPRAFVVSFKLETDVNIISKKARESLSKNSHQVRLLSYLKFLVIGKSPLDIWLFKLPLYSLM